MDPYPKRKINYYHTGQLLSVTTLQNSCIPDREYSSGLEALFDMRQSHIDKSQHEIEERKKMHRKKTPQNLIRKTWSS